MKVLLVEFNLTSKVIAYVKDEGANLNSLATTFTSIVSCELLQLLYYFLAFVLVTLCQRHVSMPQMKLRWVGV